MPSGQPWQQRTTLHRDDPTERTAERPPRPWRSTLGERPECECPEWCRLDHEHD